jgi:23S rRNA pseudouridine1911/1915/1917 synthase
MAPLLKFTITEESVGYRIDKFLTAEIKDYSRSKIQKLIENGLVTVNKSKTKKHRFLKLNDIIEIKLKEESQPKKRIKPIRIKIINATDDYIIVDKPVGITVHTDSAHPQEITLIGKLIKKYPEILDVGEDPQRPGIVHRLDKNVSGVMVVARNQKSYWDLKRQFTNRLTKKHYIALVHGRLDKLQEILDFPIARKKNGFMAAVPRGSQGRQSKTIIRVIKKYTKYTLLDITLITGRTHQIKVHLKAYNHPIVGEKTYTNKSLSQDKIEIRLSHPFLHANQLKFENLKGKTIFFSSALPQDLQDILKQLR